MDDMKKLLIIDDDKDLLKVLNALLVNKGYEIKTLSDGAKATAVVPDFRPDLIVLDVHLVNIDGRDICYQLKHNTDTKDIPILMISADTDIKEIINKCPANDFIGKPLNLASLYDKIESMTS